MFESIVFNCETSVSLGINMKSCLNGKGAYIDSFYSPSNAPSIDAIEKGMKIGDVIIAINQENITRLALNEIKAELLQLKDQSYSLSIHRYNQESQRYKREEILEDIRHRLFLKKYLKERRRNNPQNNNHCNLDPLIEKTYDLYCRIAEFLSVLCNEDEQSLDCMQDIINSLLGKYDEEEWKKNRNSGCNSIRQQFEQLLENLSLKLLDENEDDETDWITGYIQSDHYLRKVAYYHNYPNYTFIPISSIVVNKDILLLYAWYFFLLINRRSTISLVKMFSRFLGNKENDGNIDNFTKGLVLNWKESLIVRFYESEVYQYYCSMVITKSIVSIHHFVMHCFENIISLPSFVKLHFAAVVASSTSIHSTEEQSDDIILNIIQVIPLSPSSQLNHSEPTHCNYRVKKSFLGNIKNHTLFDSYRPSAGIVLSHHPLIQELRKLPALYFIPQVADSLYVDAANYSNESWSMRNLLLEGGYDGNDLSSDSSTNEPISHTSRFYSGCQLNVILPSISEEKIGEELKNWSEDIEFIEVIEDIGHKSAETTCLSTNNILHTRNDNKMESNKSSTFSLPKSFFLSTVERFKFTPSIKEDWIPVQRTFSSSNLPRSIPVISPILPTPSLNSAVIETLDGKPSDTEDYSDSEDDFMNSYHLQSKQRARFVTTAQRNSILLDLESRSTPSHSFLACTFLSKQNCFTSLREKMMSVAGCTPHGTKPSLQNLIHNAVKLLPEQSIRPNERNREMIKREEYPLNMIPELISVPLMITLYFAVLLECKIMIILDHHNTPEAIGEHINYPCDDSLVVLLHEWLVRCIHPLTWQYPVTSSLLPLPAVEELIECPTPYFSGITATTFRHLLKQKTVLLTAFGIHPCNEVVHNVPHLLFVDLMQQKVLFPSSTFQSKETHFLEMIYHRSHQIHPHRQSFPLLFDLQSLLFPNSQKYSSDKMCFSSLPSNDLLCEEIRELCIHPIISSKDLLEKDDDEAEVDLTNRKFPILQLFQHYTYDLLFGLNNCCIPILKNNIMNNSGGKDAAANCSIVQILFQEDLFYSLKYHQIHSDLCSLRSSSCLLLVPLFISFLRSFVDSQSFSHYLSHYHHHSLSSRPSNVLEKN